MVEQPLHGEKTTSYGGVGLSLLGPRLEVRRGERVFASIGKKGLLQVVADDRTVASGDNYGVGLCCMDS